MSPQTVVHLFGAVPAKKNKSFRGLLKRLGSRRLRREIVKPDLGANKDPYLLLLLADQELVEGREEQARYLVEAAYEVFDRKASSNVYELNLAG
jgi:hypothetical protein